MIPRISVILTTYNRSAWLKKAIDSVLNQTFPDFELIIVDDCSTDDTSKVVESYTDSRVRYFRLEKNWGNDTQPKNIGAKESKSEYLAYLDDDNAFRPDHLAVLVKELDANPELDMVYGDRWVIDEEKRVPDKIGHTYNFSPLVLLQKNYIDTSDVLIRKSALFDVGGWDERYRKYVDWNLWVRMVKAGKLFKRIPLIITDYYLHKSMKSATVYERGEKDTPSNPLGSLPVYKPEWDAYDLEIELPYLKEVKEPRVAIYTITYNRLGYTKKSFASLR